MNARSLITSLYTSGVTMRQIADDLGLSYSVVQRRLSKSDVQTRGRGRSVGLSPKRDPGMIDQPHVFCAQCDRRVTLLEGTNCQRRFCKA